MAKSDVPATRKDIDDVLNVMQSFMKQVDDRFNTVDDRFNYVDKRFDSQDQRFDNLELHLVEHDKQFRELNGAIAELGAQIRDYHAEMLAQSRQMDRLRDAILQIAKETGIKLQVDL